jgi:CRP-like cAMP-binding protein
VAASGKLVTLEYLGPGQWLGAMELLEGAPHLHEISAQGETSVLSLSREAFLAILSLHTELYGALLRQQAECTRRLYGQVEDLKSLGLRQRLARQLLELARRYGIPDGHDIRITLRLAQQELAQLLGASRQRINVQLKSMERQATIRMDAGALVLCNVDALQRIGDTGT